MNTATMIDTLVNLSPDHVATMDRKDIARVRAFVTVHGVPFEQKDEWLDTNQLLTERLRFLNAGTCECGVNVHVVNVMTHEAHMALHLGGAQ